MLLTTSKIKNDRLAICRNCKHFVSKTQSCGTLLVGNEVKYKNTTKQLCGCIMPIKAHLKIASCPIHKWTSVLNQKDITALKKVMGELKGSKVTGEQNKELTKLYNKLFSKRDQVSSCPSCVKSMVKKLNELLESE